MDRSRHQANGTLLSTKQRERSSWKRLPPFTVPVFLHSIGPDKGLQRSVSRLNRAACSFKPFCHLVPSCRLERQSQRLGFCTTCLCFIDEADTCRHWPVFWASFAVVLVTWGLVPTQAGIFNVRTVTRTTGVTFAVSTSSMPFDKQATGLTYRFSESTYGIVSLNETLPPYMARNYTLAPFKPREIQGSIVGQGTYTASTTMYTLDLECEDASHKADNSSNRPTYTSSGGCKFNETGLTGNDTIGDGAKYYQNGAIKKYNAMYIGYHNAGLADYYLSPNCPKSENTTFFAAFSQSKVSYSQSLLPISALHRYYGDFSTIRSDCWFCRTCQQQLILW
jgi:hypothetical protein